MKAVGRNGERESTIEVLAEVASVARRPATRRKGAQELQVSVKDSGNGNGPAIDARWSIVSPPNFQPGDKANLYVGPTTKGLWLQPGEALELAEALVAAVLEAERLAPIAEEVA